MKKSLCNDCKIRMHTWEKDIVGSDTNQTRTFWETQARARPEKPGPSNTQVCFALS